MNFTDFIEVELRQLQKLSRASHKALSEKINRMLNKISSPPQQSSFRTHISGDSSTQTVSQLLTIVMQSMDSKQDKMVMHGLTILQKLMNLKKLRPEQYEDIASHISMLKQSDDRQLQMRVIQTCLNLITPTLVSIQNYEFVTKIYTICFNVAFAKDPMTQKIAISASMQLTELIFEEKRFSGYSQEDVARCSKLFNEFLGYLTENKSPWIPAKLNGVVWDISLQIIKLQGLNTVTSASTMEKLQKMYDISLKKSFTKQIQNKYDFVRYFRALCFMSMYLKMGIKQLERFRIIHEMQAGFMLGVYLEGGLMLLTSDIMITRAHANQELVAVLEAVCQVAEGLCVNNQALSVKEAKQKQYLGQATVLLNIDVEETVEEGTVFKMVVTAVMELRGKFESSKEDQNQLRKSLQALASPLIKTLRYLAMIEFQEDWMRKLVREYQSWTILTIKFKLHKIRNKFLQELFLLTRKIDKKHQVTKCIEAVQIMFNLLYGKQEHLDPSSLVVILFCFQQLEEKIYRMRIIKQLQPQTAFDFENTLNMIDHLYSQDTILFTEQTLKWTLESLNEITLKVVEELSEHPTQKLRMEYKTFGVRKMKRVIEHNTTKIPLVWNLFIAQFICLSNCKHEEIRRYSIDILTQTISMVLIQNVMPQQQLLSIYFDIVKTKYVDVKAKVVEELKGLLENYGYRIEEATIVQITRVLKLLEEPRQGKRSEQMERLTKAEYELNELILKECLVNVTSIDCLKELISNFRIINTSKNQEYSGVGLFWMIPDHVKNLWARTNQEKYNEEFEELFRHLFERLESMILSSEYPSMRHSAIHVMTQVAAENLLNFHSQFLDTFVSCTYLEIYKATMEKFKEVTPVNKESEESDVEKDRCETCKEMWTNLLKLFKRLQNEGLLKDTYQTVILESLVSLLLLERPVFLFNLLTFIQEYQQQIPTPPAIFQSVLESLKQKQQTIDKTNKYMRLKVVGLLKEVIDCCEK